QVEEDSDVVLPCSLRTKEDITSELFVWRKDGGLKEVFLYVAGKHYNNGLVGQSEEFKGRVFHFQDELKHGNASIIIRNTKISDSGVYRCDFPHLQPRQTFYIQLVVGAAPKPYVTILEETKDRSLLQCEVHGDPEPEVEWRDSAGNTLPAEKTQVEPIGNLFYITLRTTVTQTGLYRCVATQETISHQVSDEIYVYIHVSGLSTGWIVLIVVVAVVVFVNVAGVLALMYGNEDYIAYCQIKGLSNGWTNCLVVLAALGGGVIALSVLVNKGYIILHQKKRRRVITVKEGADVVLPCSLSTKEDITFKVFVWRKAPQEHEGQKEVFLYDKGIDNRGQSEEFKGRVSHFQDELKHSNASITIRNTKISDSGEYSCYFPRLQPRQTFYIKLVVEPKVKVIVQHGRDAVLPCSLSTKEDITFKLFDWWKAPQKDEGLREVFFYNDGFHYNNGGDGQSEEFKGRVSHFQDELKHGNASIIIRNTTISDSGEYRCDFPRLQPRQTFNIELVVEPSKVIKGRRDSDVVLPCSLSTRRTLHETL
ncbi:uncharacterized protein LOC116685297, partial [Etheostoma spectabile]|uniref:uncharacterized protein LOC116685297 n=1 Tax=Etheostoma spectabile TaxID=54343 RepID=UPI0013AEB121